MKGGTEGNGRKSTEGRTVKKKDERKDGTNGRKVQEGRKEGRKEGREEGKKDGTNLQQTLGFQIVQSVSRNPHS